ncbi:hypothetical protein ACT4Z6_16295 [Acinetobacter baumannii]
MSEFKVGDKVVCKYEHIILFGNVVLEIKNFREDLKEIGDFCTFTNGNDYWLSALRFATPEEIAAGHRIDMPTLPKPIGSLQELHPEFAKVLNENFLELISDDSHTENCIGCVDKPSDSGELETLDKPENHISPNCEVKNG